MCFACKCIYALCVPGPLGVRERHWIPLTGIKNSCEPLCGCWGLNLDPFQEHQVLLINEPSFQSSPRNVVFNIQNIVTVVEPYSMSNFLNTTILREPVQTVCVLLIHFVVN